MAGYDASGGRSSFRTILILVCLAGALVHVALRGRNVPELTIDVRATKPELVRVLLNMGFGFSDRAALDTSIRVGAHRLRFALPADSTRLKQIEIAPVLAGGPTTVERIALGYPGLERVWDSSTGFDNWRLPDANPAAFAAGQAVTCTANEKTALLLLQDVPGSIHLGPRIHRRRVASILAGWMVAGLLVALLPLSAVTTLHHAAEWTSRPDRLFALIAPIGCAIFLTINPPLQVADEPGHLFRSWQLSRGVLHPDTVDGFAGGPFPNAFVDFRDPHRPLTADTRLRIDPELTRAPNDSRVDPNATTVVRFPAIGIHSSVPYVPQAVGLWIGRCLTDRPHRLILAGRIANALICGLVVWYAIRISGRFGYAFLAVALLPQFLHQLSSLSADAMTNALAFLGMALPLQWRDRQQSRIRLREQIAYLALILTLAWCKTVYFGWPALLWLVPGERFGSQRRRVLLFAVSFGMAMGSFLLWSRIVRAYWPDPHTLLGDVVSRSEQLAFVLRNPEWFLGSIAECWMRHYGTLSTQLVGMFCSANVPLPPPAVFIALVTLLLGILVFRAEGETAPISVPERVMAIGLFSVAMLLTCLGLYLWWTPVGGRTLDGFQGRYLHPLLPLLAIAFDSRCLPVLRRDWRVGLGIAFVSAGLLVVSGWTIWTRFYGL